MGKQVPPPWILRHWLIRDFNFNKDLNNWVYIGASKRLPKNFQCRYCGRDLQAHIDFFGITHGQQDPLAVGACKHCDIVYWMKLKLDAFHISLNT
ncbi:MAG TPA: hypothetical protein DER60_02195 [Syntrophomonas sp.]|nr:hypothetical protein [Syntrophomonas sp.]